MRRSLSALKWQRIYELQGSWCQREQQYTDSGRVLNIEVIISAGLLTELS